MKRDHWLMSDLNIIGGEPKHKICSEKQIMSTESISLKTFRDQTNVFKIQWLQKLKATN